MNVPVRPLSVDHPLIVCIRNLFWSPTDSHLIPGRPQGMHSACSPLPACRRRLSSARLASADLSMNTNVFKLQTWSLDHRRLGSCRAILLFGLIRVFCHES